MSQGSDIRGLGDIFKHFPGSSGSHTEATGSSPVDFGVIPLGPQWPPLQGVPNEAGSFPVHLSSFLLCGPAGHPNPCSSQYVTFSQVHSRPAVANPLLFFLIRTGKYIPSLGSVYNPTSCRDFSKSVLGVMCLFSQHDARVLLEFRLLLFFCFSSVLFCPQGPPCRLRYERISPKRGPAVLSCNINVNSCEELEASLPPQLFCCAIFCSHFQKAIQEGPVLCSDYTEELQSIPSEEEVFAPEKSSRGFPEATPRSDCPQSLQTAAGRETGRGGKEETGGRRKEEAGGGGKVWDLSWLR